MLLRWHFLPIRHRPPFGERVVRAIHTYKLQNFFLNFRLSLFLNFLPPISRFPPSQHTASAANTRFCRRGGHRTRHAQGDTGGIESQFRHRFIVLQIKNGVTSLAPSQRTTQTSLYANLPAPGLARQPLVLAVPALRTHRVQQMLLHRFLGFSVHVRESLQR